MKAQTLTCVELRALAAAEQWLYHHARRETGNGGAVLGGDIVEIVDRLEAAGSRHVLRNEPWIARDVAAHMARERPRIDVIAAAGAEADHHLDGLAGVEIGLGRGRWRCRQSRQRKACQPIRAPTIEITPPAHVPAPVRPC
jgi:hypothetical protein